MAQQPERRIFVAGLGGIAALSADARTEFSQGTLTSQYKPENGLAVNVAAGRHFNDWVSVQGNYIWNRNQVRLSGTDGALFYDLPNSSRQHQIVVDGMLYFRPLTSRVRPYLSTGFAAVHISREQTGSAAPPLPSRIPEPSASAWYPGVRVAVGVDLLLSNGWGFRYSFSETLSPNLFSKSLTPPASSNLMNFQNLWGFVKYF